MKRAVPMRKDYKSSSPLVTSAGGPSTLDACVFASDYEVSMLLRDASPQSSFDACPPQNMNIELALHKCQSISMQVPSPLGG